MTLESLVIYKGLVLGLLVHLAFWGVMVLPVKSEIKGKVGKPTYRKLLKEYNLRAINQYFGLFFIVAGLIVFSSLSVDLDVFNTLKENWQLSSWKISTIGSGLIFFGVQLRFIGYVNAMSNLM